MKLLNKQVLYEKTFGPESARKYIEKKGMQMSEAVDVDYTLAIKAENQRGKFQISLDTVDEDNTTAIRVFHSLIDQGTRERNAYSWLMIKTAMDEAKQNFRYVEDRDWYFDHMFDDGGMSFTKKMNLEMIRYFTQTRSKLMQRRMVAPFQFTCWQYTLLKMQEKGYSLQDYTQWRKYHPQKGTRINQEIN